ncbi:MAG: bifunctional chorismate mutase/prephenate dehydratase, partial [Chloroflexi bacterium]
MADPRVPVNVAYQGLAGAFSEAAATALFPEAALVPRRTFAEVFGALASGEADAAVVPVENTHAGSVADVYDLLRHHHENTIVAELILRVRHSLLGVRGARLEDVRVARSHPQALAQSEAAERYDLDVLADAIETAADNFTRFFAVAPSRDREIVDRIPPSLRRGPIKTSLAYKTANLPGALVRSLQPFATAWIQLSKIESRPSRAAPWDYVFYLDFEG